MKRFWLFAGLDYYPSAGMCDFYGSFDSLEEGIIEGRKLISEQDLDWLQVFDTEKCILYSTQRWDSYAAARGKFTFELIPR